MVDKTTERRIKRIGLGVILLVMLGACGPEAGRPRGGGIGGDIGNHAPQGEIPASKVWNERDDP